MAPGCDFKLFYASELNIADMWARGSISVDFELWRPRSRARGFEPKFGLGFEVLSPGGLELQ